MIRQFTSILVLSISIICCTSAEKLNYNFDSFLAKIDSLDCKDLVLKYSKENQENDSILYYLAVAEFKCGDFQNALINIDKSIRINESYPFKYYAKSRILRKIGDFQNALNEIEKANKIFPNNYYILITKAELLYFNRNFESALNLLDLMNDELKDDAEVYRLKALVYMNEMKTEKSFDNIKKAISLNSKDSYLNYLAGDILVKGKKYKESLEYLNRAIELDINNSDSYLKRGLAFYYLGDKLKCKEDWVKCAKLGNTQGEKYIKTYLE